MQTNEFRVRPVTRYQLTHYQRDEKDVFLDVSTLSDSEKRSVKVTAGGGSLRTVGEFPSVEAAEEVGVALQALVPGSTLETIEGRQAAYPPKALAAAMAVRTMDKQAIYTRHAAILRECHRRGREAAGQTSLLWSANLSGDGRSEGRQPTCDTPEQTQRYHAAADAYLASIAPEIAALHDACAQTGGHVNTFPGARDQKCSICGCDLTPTA